MKNHPVQAIAWHRLLGEVLEKLLSPVGLLVYTEQPVMNKPPKMDILILRREQANFTSSQLQRLPDGVRDTQASHLLLEFKYTESLTEKACQQALAYDFFYQQVHELTDADLQTFLLVAKQPQADRLTQLGYVETSHPGVYQSPLPLLRKVILLSLNELSDAPHNAFVKCFATQQREKRKAFKVLWDLFPQWQLPNPLIWLLDTLWGYWFSSPPGGNMKRKSLTTTEVKQIGSEWKQYLLSGVTIDDVLKHFPPEEVLAQFKAKDVVARFKLEEVLAQFKPRDVVAQFKPEEVLAQFKLEEIENYLTRMKHSSPKRNGRAQTKSR